MGTFFKWLFGFILGIVMIVAANMAYDYIRVIWYGNIINKAVEDYNNEVEDFDYNSEF